MKKWNISWAAHKHGKFSGGNADNPSWNFISEKVHEICKRGGVVTLMSSNEDSSIENLQLQSNGIVFVMMHGRDANDDYEVSPITDQDENIVDHGGTVVILGDYWDESMTCRDIDFVINSFNKFWNGHL